MRLVVVVARAMLETHHGTFARCDSGSHAASAKWSRARRRTGTGTAWCGLDGESCAPTVQRWKVVCPLCHLHQIEMLDAVPMAFRLRAFFATTEHGFNPMSKAP